MKTDFDEKFDPFIVLENAPYIIWVTDSAGQCIYLNRLWYEFTGQKNNQGLGLGWTDAILQEDKEIAKAIFIEANATKKHFKVEYRLWHKDGSFRWVTDYATPRFDENNNFLGYIGGVTDIDALKTSESNLLLSNSRFKAAIDAVESVIWTNSATGLMTDPQPGWEKLTGQTFEEYQGVGWSQALHPDDIEPTIKAWNESVRTKIKFEFEHRVKSRNGEWRTFAVKAIPLLNNLNEIVEWVGVHTDITDKKEYESHIEHIATHDALSNLPNRILLNDRLQQLITQREQHTHAILFMDVDRFKTINDAFGHSFGDQLLCEVGKKLSRLSRQGDTVARIGGDEYVILLANIQSEESVASVVEKLLEEMATPIHIDGNEVTVSLSVGGAIFPKDGQNVDTLLKHADLAMYQAKEEGKATFRFFNEELNVKLKEKLFLEKALKKALAGNEFYLVYQPIINIANKEVVGVEALIRWQQPERGLIHPDQFIPLAEDMGLSPAIDYWVLQTACAQAALWNRSGLNLSISVNVSAKQMSNLQLPMLIKEILAEVGLPSHFLEIEITETCLMDNIEAARQVIDCLKEQGIRIAVDDFGVGFSSLNYLKSLAISTLKIDRSFIADIKEDNDFAIISAITALAKALNLNIIGEGIEEKWQIEFLKKYGCINMQGYYFSKPIAAEIIPNFVSCRAEGFGI